jgi:hypothetical protein
LQWLAGLRMLRSPAVNTVPLLVTDLPVTEVLRVRNVRG